MQNPDKNTPNESIIRGENKVQSIKFGHANIYLIKTESDYILVDAGMPNKEKELDEVFEIYGVDPKNVQLIILTHGHLDHVGSLGYAQKVTGGKVLCHHSYSDQLVKGEPESATPRNFLGRLLNFLTSISGTKFEGIKPDILVEDEFDLTEYGISGKVIHTPGHSKSSVSIMLDNGEALIGDMIREEGSGEIGPGMFYEDKVVLLESLKKVATFEPRIIYLSHGKYIDYPTLRNVIDTVI